MADGRILSKRISRSDKVSTLSTDTARMIYSWIIPYLDVEGRMEANPRLMKSDIAPLLDHITPLIIQNILKELDSIGLIVLYQSENKQYLQLVKFDENQPNLRKDREKKSQIPKAPAKIKVEKAEVRQESGEAPAEVPHKINIREVNIREAKGTPEQHQPVDNSLKGKPALSEKQKQLQGIKPIFEQVKTLYPEFNIQLFFQNHIRDNIEAVKHTLNTLIASHEKGIVIENPMAWCEAIMKNENMNYNAADEDKKTQEFKRDKNPMTSLGNIMSGMLKSMPAH